MEVKDLIVNQYKWGAAFARNMVDVLTNDLTDDELNWQPRPGHHSMWHNIWHMFLADDYYAGAALDMPAVWDEGDWRNRIDLSTMTRAFEFPGPGMGNGEESVVPRFVIFDVPDDVVNDLKAPPLEQYLAYVDDLHATTSARLIATPIEHLTRKVSSYRLTTPAFALINFGHNSRHIGMMEDIKGLMRGPGTGTASI